MKKRFNVIAAAVLALGMVVGMCGCEGQLPQPKTTQRQDAPNLTAKQEKTIRTNILKTLDQCNRNRRAGRSVLDVDLSTSWNVYKVFRSYSCSSFP